MERLPLDRLVLEHRVSEDLGVDLVGDGLHLVARRASRSGTAALATVAGVAPRDVGLATRSAELLGLFVVARRDEGQRGAVDRASHLVPGMHGVRGVLGDLLVVVGHVELGPDQT
eukprot:scaffold13109_cov45-Phaeocystis_antarctica.AAC.2